ncbi:MAG: hypothetical protein QOF21_1988 [Actinomycetota bacterium]
MGAIQLEWDNVRSVCEEAAARAVALIRNAPTPDARVPGLDWTVREVAAHLVSLTERYEPFVRDQSRPSFESMPALNAEELSPLAVRTLGQLADDLERGTRSLLALCPSGDAPARFFDMQSDCASAIALHVEELLVHGVDIARATGATWSISRREALVAIAGTAQVMPKFVDAEVTRGRRIVFEIRLRGGPTMGVTFDDGALTISEGRVARADCRISADPAAFLLAGTGRTSQWRALATGKVLAFGRKPWLGLQFRKYLVPA